MLITISYKNTCCIISEFAHVVLNTIREALKGYNAWHNPNVWLCWNIVLFEEISLMLYYILTANHSFVVLTIDILFHKLLKENSNLVCIVEPCDQIKSRLQCV